MDNNVLRQKIIEEHDTILFDESIACYKGNALRAAFITNWINIAESLKFKFYDMAQRDHEINRKVISKIEDLEQKERPTDSLLIKSADELGLITKEQKLKLEHLKTMRGVYAHPLRKEPTKKEVELAIEFGVDIVLSQPALLKHAFVRDLSTSIFENHHFLDDNEEKVRMAAQNTLNHINPIVYPYFFDLLIKKSDRVYGELTKEIFIKRGQVFLECLLHKSIEGFSSTEWKLVEMLHDYPLIVSDIFIQDKFWSMIEEDIQDSIIGYLIEPVQAGVVKAPSQENISKVLDLYHLDMLTTRHIERLKIAAEKCSLYKRMLSEIPLEWYQEELISELKSSNWYSQNAVIEVLEGLGPERINSLDRGYLIELGRNVLQAADGNAMTAIDFVATLSRNTDEWSSSFIEGIFLETFINHKNQIRFKRYPLLGLKAISDLRRAERKIIIENAITLLDESIPKSWVSEDEFNKYINIIEEEVERVDESSKDILTRFKDAFVKTKERMLKEDE